jgi:hypothetical protein
MFKYLLVDEHWTHIGVFESDIPDWFVGSPRLRPHVRDHEHRPESRP